MNVSVTIPGGRARNIIALERQKRAMELRTRGWSYARIAQDLGVTDVAVIKMVRKALGRQLTIMSESVEEVRQQEIQRLDAIIAAHWEWVLKADEKSSAIVLRCMERRASYLGLDAPKKLEVTEKSDIDRQLEELIRRANISRQVPATVEIDCTSEPVDAGGNVEHVVGLRGSRLREETRLLDPGPDTLRLDDDGEVVGGGPGIR